MENISPQKDTENFEKLGDRAEEVLLATDNRLDTTMQSLPTEKYEALMEKMVDETAEKLTDALIKNIEFLGSSSYEKDADISLGLISPLLSNFPSQKGEVLIKKILSRKECRDLFDVFLYSSEVTVFYSVISSVLGNNFKKEQFNGSAPIQPLSLVFDKNDFSRAPINFGSFLNGNTEILLNGDVSAYVGKKMVSGTIIINGNTAENTGDEMMGGKIIINGNTGDGTGRGMKDGTLEVRGEVKGFALEAFSRANQGTIIWGNTTIWSRGEWTREGKEMQKNGQIPITEYL